MRAKRVAASNLKPKKPRHPAALVLVASAALAAVVYVDWKAVDVAPEPRLVAVSVASAIWVFAITLAVHGTKRPWLLNWSASCIVVGRCRGNCVRLLGGHV